MKTFRNSAVITAGKTRKSEGAPSPLLTAGQGAVLEQGTEVAKKGSSSYATFAISCLDADLLVRP